MMYAWPRTFKLPLGLQECNWELVARECTGTQGPFPWGVKQESNRSRVVRLYTRDPSSLQPLSAKLIRLPVLQFAVFNVCIHVQAMRALCECSCICGPCWPVARWAHVMPCGLYWFGCVGQWGFKRSGTELPPILEKGVLFVYMQKVESKPWYPAPHFLVQKQRLYLFAAKRQIMISCLDNKTGNAYIPHLCGFRSPQAYIIFIITITVSFFNII